MTLLFQQNLGFAWGAVSAPTIFPQRQRRHMIKNVGRMMGAITLGGQNGKQRSLGEKEKT